VIAFDNANKDQELIFEYNVDGTTTQTANKFLVASILAFGCNETVTDGAITVSDTLTATGATDYEGLLTATVDIDNGIIATSTYFTDNADQTATIKFCIRVDYYFDSDGEGNNERISMSFHETDVTVMVDLNAEFGMTDVAITPLNATNFEDLTQTVGYTLKAYHCATANSATDTGAPVFNQENSLLSICVAVQDASGFMYVNSIRELEVSQNNGGPATVTDLITGGSVNPAFVGITDVDCASIPNICQIQNQLSMAFFESGQPIQIAGVAEVAFGQEGAVGGRQLRQVPINIRYLGESTTNDFFLTADVKKTEDEGLGVAGTVGVVGAGVAAVAAVAFVAMKVMAASAATGGGAAAASATAGATSSATMASKAVTDAGMSAAMQSSSSHLQDIEMLDEEAGTVDSGSVDEVRSRTVGPFVNIPE